MTTIAVAAPTDFEQQLDAEIVRLTDMKQDLQGQLDDIEASIDQVEKFRESYEPHPRSAIQIPEPVTAAAPAARKKPAKKNSASKVASSIVKDPPKGGTKAQVLELLKAGPQSQADLQRQIGVSSPTMSTSCKQLHAQGAIQSDGKDGRSTIWKLPSKQIGGAKPAEKKTAPPADSGTQQPLLEGRIFSLLQYQRLSSQKLADELDASVDEVRKVLAKLLADDEVRKFGETPYDTWEGTGL